VPFPKFALTQKGMSREASYEAVQRNAMKVWLEGANFLHELKKDPAITEKLTTDELCALFDTSYHTKHVETIFNRVFGAQ
jgi:adenylosuccinate lyase